MSEKTSTAEIQVHVVRPGVAARDYHLPEGATLADLLCRSGAPAAGQAVLVDGVTPEEALALRDGAVVTIVPQPGHAAGAEPWRATIPAFRDEDLFREYTEALEARRRAEDPEEGPSA
jgi:sulfur carrier protein ThiS